jgi:hypothetical protein
MEGAAGSGTGWDQKIGGGQDKELQKLGILMNVFDESFAIECVRIWVCRELILLSAEEGDAMELSQKQRILEVVR